MQKKNEKKIILENQILFKIPLKYSIIIFHYYLEKDHKWMIRLLKPWVYVESTRLGCLGDPGVSPPPRTYLLLKKVLGKFLGGLGTSLKVLLVNLCDIFLGS